MHIIFTVRFYNKKLCIFIIDREILPVILISRNDDILLCIVISFICIGFDSQWKFCGVAEMIGPVDFNKDMDFWQQDKWSGSFPVKWYIIKDVSNANFRHIILENNENKPVTNSRDTQEVCILFFGSAVPLPM